MKKGGIIAIIIIVAIILIGGCNACSSQHSMVDMEQTVKQKWANVESQYQRRSDLIPNLVSTVKGAANFEKSTLTQVIQARASATSVNIDANNLSPQKIKQFQQAQGQLTSALSHLMMVSERYPKLTATQNFSDLQTQLEGTENRINTSRIQYNEAVRNYNAFIKKFPTNLYAGLFGFSEKGMFEADKGADKAPQVSF